jgi:hypothetical protein
MKMNRIILVFFAIFLFAIQLSSQESDMIVVNAGTLIKSVFPPAIRYRYPEFTEGLAVMKNGNVTKDRFNYNLLLGNMEFIKDRDTLSIVNKKDLKLITLGIDTFYYFNGYLELIRSGTPRVYLKQLIALKEVRKTGAFGTTARSAAVDSHTYLATSGNITELRPEEDWVFQKTHEYYFSSGERPFVLFTRKNAIRSAPGHKQEIMKFIKDEKISFGSRDDLLKFAEYLGSLPDVYP